MAEEVERKYLNVTRDGLRPRLMAAGAVLHEAAHFESNTVYDTEDGRLIAGRQLLRLRVREWPGRTDARLTFKAPLPPVLAGGRLVKRREEIELGVDDPAAMGTILLRLGYRERGRYEKVRESWTLGSAHVDMDELPFMSCVEIEAAPQEIARLEQILSLDSCPVSANSYHVLFQEWLTARGLPAQDSFTFDLERRQRLRIDLAL